MFTNAKYRWRRVSGRWRAAHEGFTAQKASSCIEKNLTPVSMLTQCVPPPAFTRSRNFQTTNASPKAPARPTDFTRSCIHSLKLLQGSAVFPPPLGKQPSNLVAALCPCLQEKLAPPAPSCNTRRLQMHHPAVVASVYTHTATAGGVRQPTSKSHNAREHQGWKTSLTIWAKCSSCARR